MMKPFATCAVACALVAGGADLAHAEKRDMGVRGIGPRLGLSIDPDQIHFGGHLDLGDLANRLSLGLAGEVGFGDDLTVLTIFADFHYRFPTISSGWYPYAGGGIGPVFVSRDGGGDDTELGLTAQGGLARRNDSGRLFFAELEFGLVDTPDVKITFGWTFGQ